MYHEEYLELRAQYRRFRVLLHGRGVQDIPPLIPCNASQEEVSFWSKQMRVRFRLAGLKPEPSIDDASQLIVVL